MADGKQGKKDMAQGHLRTHYHVFASSCPFQLVHVAGGALRAPPTLLEA